MRFASLYTHGFVRVAACRARNTAADPAANADAIAALATNCHGRGVALAVFPELSLSGYAIDDLLLQKTLLDAVEAGLARLQASTAALLPVVLVGAPLRHGNRVYNTAIALHRGRVLGVVPKTYLPNYREFYEARYFASGAGVAGETIRLGGQDVPFGPDLLFACADLPDFRIGVEICEDLWIPIPPSSDLALNGALVLANLSASPITIGRASSRELLCQSQSARCLAAYVYTAAGAGESTTDLAWDGQAVIFENGVKLAESPRFDAGAQITVADIDLDLLRQERAQMGTFDDNRRAAGARGVRTIPFRLDPPDAGLGLERRVERFPFVPADRTRLAQDCYEAYNIQVAGLVQRLQAVQARPVIGVSGGLDSTHALIVCAKAMDILGRPRADIHAVTMPGFATGHASKDQAHRLMAALGVTARELDIRPAARQMLADLGHPASQGQDVYDVTYENVQAGLRTDYLFRLANQHQGIVIGTGDLSELALGWCTYGVGDQMAHYNVNAGVPKTLIQHLIRFVIGTDDVSPDARQVLEAVLAAEISPELVPVAAGQPPQRTEARIGPYELQDFNLYYLLRHGFGPPKIAFLALHAWGRADRGDWPPGFPVDRRRQYGLDQIKPWLRLFLQRFFAAQFKRSAMPNGPKVVAGGSLSPRGDWRAPSDALASAWLATLDQIPEDG